MASINSYGHDFRDGRWTHGSGNRPSQAPPAALSSYKGGEGVNVDQPADDDSDSDRSDSGGPPRSAAQRIKDRAQKAAAASQSKGSSKVAAAKGKRKLRERRRGTGVVHLTVNDQSTGDSLDDDDDDEDKGNGAKQDMSNNEVHTASSPSPTASGGNADTPVRAVGRFAAVDPVSEHQKSGQRVLPSSGYGRSWQADAPPAGAADGGSPTKDDSTSGSALRSCLKGTAGSSKDPQMRRPVTSLVSRFEQNWPTSAANGVSSAASVATPANAVRSSRDEAFQAHMQQPRNAKEEEEDVPARFSTAHSGPSVVRSSTEVSKSGALPSGPATAGRPETRAVIHQAAPTARVGSTNPVAQLPPSPAAQTAGRAPVLPPWKQSESAPAVFSRPATSRAQATSATGRAAEDTGSCMSSLPSRSSVADTTRSEELQRKVTELQKVIEQLQADNGHLHKLLADREREVEKLNRDVLVKDDHIAELNSSISALDRDLEELDRDNVNLAEENDALRRAVAALSTT